MCLKHLPIDFISLRAVAALELMDGNIQLHVNNFLVYPSSSAFPVVINIVNISSA